ncbi:MAG: hypothetical protein ABIG63_17500 [Chloroflexota bacterium]
MRKFKEHRLLAKLEALEQLMGEKVKELHDSGYEAGWEALMNELFNGNLTFCPENCPGNFEWTTEPPLETGLSANEQEELAKMMSSAVK